MLGLGLLILGLSALNPASANVGGKDKVLVLTDKNDLDKEYGGLLEAIKIGDKFQVEQVNIHSSQFTKKSKYYSSLSVEDDEIPSFHTIYLISSSLPKEWSASQISLYVKSGGNFFIETGAGNNYNFKSVLKEFGIEVFEGKTKIIGDGKFEWNCKHSFFTLINEDNKNENRALDNNASAFKLQNDPKSDSSFNPLVQSALNFAPGTCICTSNLCHSNTASVSLMATLESRKGSRFLAISVPKLINSLSKKQLDGIVGWLQGSPDSKFNIKISSVSHQLAIPSDQIISSPNRGRTELDSTIYRVNDKINIRMCLINFNNDRFIPSNPFDFQFELKMMNTQLRRSFDTIDSDGCLKLKEPVQLLGKPAVYTLKINYNRPGWSQLSHNERLLVRPFRHDEFPRFLKVAVPYYASWIGLLVASYFILLPNLFKNLK